VTETRLPEDRILFGAAFYDEYRVTGSLERDLDLMVAASFSVIRVGESVWATWEPEPGRYELDWMQPILDGAHARGLSVILGTPTYAVPPWLRAMADDMAAESATGQPVPWGWRQEVDFTHPVFLDRAERVVRAILERYAAHPAVIGFQVDNEPGAFLLHNDRVFAGFLDWLKARYGSVQELNEQWGLTYWSHRITEWTQLWRPDGNHSPQYQLEWRRYQSELVTSFIAQQADIVREYADPAQFVTTCISYERPAIDERALVAPLDITAGNPYYKMQDGLRIGVEDSRADIWWSTGVWALFGQADRMFATAQERYLVTETNAQSIGQSHWQNHTPYPGQIAQAALTLVSRGARMIEYWQWQTLHFGIETYWGGVLPHSGKPGRIYREIAELGRRLDALGPHLVDFQPDADVALLYSTDTKRSFEFYPPLADADGGPDRRAYLHMYDRYFRAVFETRAQGRMLHVEQFLARDSAEFVAEFPTLIVPVLYVATDETLRGLLAYARAGGHLVLGTRTAYADHLARARPVVAPAVFAEPAGVWFDEYTTLDQPVPVDSAALGAGHGESWADGLIDDGADVLARFAAGLYAGRPAVTTRVVGAGRITYVGTVPSRELAKSLVSWAVPQRTAAGWQADSTVSISSGVGGGGRVWFLSNWSPDSATVVPPPGGGISSIVLGPWDSRVLVERRDPEPGAGTFTFEEVGKHEAQRTQSRVRMGAS